MQLRGSGASASAGNAITSIVTSGTPNAAPQNSSVPHKRDSSGQICLIEIAGTYVALALLTSLKNEVISRNVSIALKHEKGISAHQVNQFPLLGAY
jgi:hypothetical protein